MQRTQTGKTGKRVANTQTGKRVANTAEILQRDRDVAVLMRRLIASDLQLHQLPRDTLQRILE